MESMVDEQKQGEYRKEEEEAGDENKQEQEEGEDGKNEVGDETTKLEQGETGEELDRFKLLESTLVVKLPSNNDHQPEPGGQPEEDGGHRGTEEGLEDGFKTPTGEEYMISPMLECPPAPRRQREPRQPAVVLGRRRRVTASFGSF